MMKATIILMALLAVEGASEITRERSDTLVSFDGGIGVIPAQNAGGRSNVVKGVDPAGGPWRIGDLKAFVHSDGRIRVKGRGLLLASTNSLGTNAKLSVFATLICEPPDSQTFTPRSNAQAVELEPNGDFRIDDVLDPLPVDCSDPVLLIRSAANGTWLAAGIQKIGEDD
jgi:hypothetical protein